MSILYFAGALLGIVVLAIAINHLTGTKANYLENLQFAPGKKELWRDTQADFAVVPRLFTDHLPELEQTIRQNSFAER